MAIFFDNLSIEGRVALQRLGAQMVPKIVQLVAAYRDRGQSDFHVLAEQTRAATARHDSEVEALGPRPIACGRGCNACCSWSISVTFGEALVVAEHLRDERPELIPAIEAAAARIRALPSHRERYVAALPCVFLLPDGTCGIYPYRPLACRGATSPDASLCGDPEGVTEIPQHAPSKSILLEIMMGLTVLNNLVTGRPRTGEFINGIACALAALDVQSFDSFDDWFAHVDDSDNS